MFFGHDVIIPCTMIWNDTGGYFFKRDCKNKIHYGAHRGRTEVRLRRHGPRVQIFGINLNKL